MLLFIRHFLSLSRVGCVHQPYLRLNRCFFTCWLVHKKILKSLKISNLAVSIIGRYFFKNIFLCYFHRFIIWNFCHKFLAKTEHFAFLKLWVGFRNKKFSKRQFLWNCLKHNNKLVNIKLPVSVNISDFFPDLANSWHLIFRHVTWLCNYVTSC